MRPVVVIENLEVIAPNFKRRLSGVTSTIVQLIPAQRALGCNIAVLGPGLPAHLPHLRFRDLRKLWRKPQSGANRVWHARRNAEMLPGIVLRDLLRMPIRLIFTSASQRHHTAYTKFLIGKMDHVIAVSDKTAAYLDVPCTVIMHGIDTARFCPPQDKAKAKSDAGLPSDKKIVGCFGRIRHQKGTDRFVEAMTAFLPNHPDWIAVIAGRATAEHAGFDRSLRNRVETAGLAERILFVGEHTDIERWYQALDLFVAPQRWEGFGLTPLEAMSCGVPVAATDVGAFSELVIDGVTGLLTENEDAAIAAAAVQLADDQGKREAMAAVCREHILDNFRLAREAEQINAVYAGLRRAGDGMWKARETP